MELDKENLKRITKIVAFGVILYFLLQNLAVIRDILGNIIDIISPFLVGIALAFIVNIPMSSFERRLFKPKKLKDGTIKQSKLKRPVCILLAFVLLIMIISFVVKLVIPQLINVIVMFVSDVPRLAYNLKDWAIDLTQQYPDISKQIQGLEFDWQKITNDVISFASNLASSVVTSSIGFVVSLIGGILNGLIAIVFAFYILISKESLAEQFKKVIQAYLPERKAKNVLEICDLSKNTFYNFLTGQCIEAVILGCLCFICMLLLRLPFAATISVLVGVMNLLPIVGAFIGIIIGAILILSVSPIKALVFIVFLLVLQQIEGNLIYPRVVGNSVGLPGMWVLVAVVVGGNLGGILGLVIGLPLISVLFTILRNDMNQRLEEKRQEKS